MPSAAQTSTRPKDSSFLLQRRAFLRARLFNQTGDAAQLGVHRRGHDDGLARARRDAGAHEHHVLAVAERDVVLLQSRGLLRHRLRLAGQRGLDALERGRLQEPGIGRDQVAGFQREDVTGDDSRGRNRSDLPIASHLGLGRGQLLERRDGLLRVELLVEADDGVEDDDGEDGDGVHHFAQHAGDDTGRDENPDDEALELAEENLQRADALAFLQLVRAIGREALRRFLRRESGRCGTELGQHLLGRLAVPGLASWLCGDGGCRGHAVPSIPSPALGGAFVSSAILFSRHTERAIISSSSVRMMRTANTYWPPRKLRRRWPSFAFSSLRKALSCVCLTGMLLGSRFLDPVSLAIVMSVQAGLIIPGWQRILRVFR